MTAAADVARLTARNVPERYVVVRRTEETPDTATLTLEPTGRPIPSIAPGQFTMLYAPGIGEVPVSVSGTGPRLMLTQTIRSVGAVSRALSAKGPGKAIGVRGPFGSHWDLAGAEGDDLLLVAGGIGLAPLRTALLAALTERARYRRIIVLIGARSPQELLFWTELEDWRHSGAQVLVTVDRAAAGWTGNVGLVTQLIDRAALDPSRTTALVCGPEVMIRISAWELAARGVADSRIQVSLERNMRCGVGECGHCQLGPVLLCRDGPVLSYQVAAPLLAIGEL